MIDAVSPKHLVSTLTELWSPRVIAEVDDAYIKVAKVHGSLAWHSHENENELFLVLKGRLRIEMESGVVELDEGEMFVVPKGVRHNPIAEEECHLMLIESKSTAHTGDVTTEKTRSLADQLRPVRKRCQGRFKQRRFQSPSWRVFRGSVWSGVHFTSCSPEKDILIPAHSRSDRNCVATQAIRSSLTSDHDDVIQRCQTTLSSLRMRRRCPGFKPDG